MGILRKQCIHKLAEGSLDGSHMVCKLKKSIYELKQPSYQWYTKLHAVRISWINVYINISGSKLMIFCLPVTIWICCTNIAFSFSKFWDEELDEISYFLGLEIHRDRSKQSLGLSQKAFIKKVLKRFRI